MAADASEREKIAAFPLVSGHDSDVEALTAVIRRLASAQSLPEVMEIVTHAARVILAADGITFVLRDGERCYYAEEDAIGPLWKGRRFPMSACISGWCMEHARSVAIPDIYEDERIPQGAYRPTFVKSLAMVPVRQEEPIAAMGAYWARPHHASAPELELLQTISNAAALSIAYIQLRETQSGAAWRRLKRRVAALRSPHFGPLNVWSPSPSFAWSRRLRQAAVGLAMAAAAVALRLALAPLVGNEAPYTFSYAAIVLGVASAGWLAGVFALVAGGLAGNLLFAGSLGELHFTGSALWALLIYLAVGVALLVFTDRLVTTSQREKELNRKLQLVRGELQHRIKNFITVVQALAVQTGRSSSDAADFDAKFTKRLQALAGAQALIDDPKHSSAGLALLVDRTLAPFYEAERVKVASASDVRVSEDVAAGLALILNELATNALKYGSLSAPDGKVSITVERVGDRARLVWLEQGGPRVAAPSRNGFGTRLIRSALPHGSGTAEIDYRPRGLQCRIDFACTEQ
jgi:two-component sensor histidine kinase